MLTAVYDPGLCLHPFETKHIRFAFHDIDGTHSLIRDWPPVMSTVLNDVIENGLPNGYDSPENCQRLIRLAGKHPIPETDSFCVESAGLSALTQMEWSIRRAIEEGRIDPECKPAANSDKIRRIRQGEERFDDMPDPEPLQKLLAAETPRLFKLYERVLNGYCRDRNLALAKKDPERFRVKGSFDFLRFLSDNGVRNYFVTGAVVQKGTGMFEEVETLGYPIGPGRMIEDIIGSTWDEKLPKDEIMHALLVKLGADGSEVLVTGDGRSEIAAGHAMGALTISRLPESATRQRRLHVSLGTCMIVPDFASGYIYRVLRPEQ